MPVINFKKLNLCPIGPDQCALLHQFSLFITSYRTEHLEDANVVEPFQ